MFQAKSAAPYPSRGFRLSIRVLTICLLLVAAALWISCGGLSNSTSSKNSTTNNVALRITLTPLSPNITSGSTQQFTALVENSSNTAVTWSASIGAISSTGLFTAPKVTDPQPVTVIASSAADSTGSAKAVATVVPAQTLAALKIITSQLTNEIGRAHV
jgi:hypothetical protein